MSNSETQNDELLALQSIYDEKCFVVEHTNPPCGRFSAHVELPQPFYIKLRNCNTCTNKESPTNSSEDEYEKFEVSHLPPINLHFEYPESYPSDSPPAFLLSCSWLLYDQLCKLCKHLDALWDESNGEVILFQWIQFLKDETLSFLQIEECLDITELSKFNLKVDLMNALPVDIQSFSKKCVISDNKNKQNSDGASVSESQKNSMTLIFPKPSVSGGNGFRDCRAFLDIADGKVLRSMLKDYNEFKKAEAFSESYHLCDICYSNKLGSDFVTFRACHHFFCRDCVKSFFELMISDGSVNSLNCLHDKCNTQADGTLVKQIVSKDCFERYDLLLLSRTLDTMSDIAYCPRKACQCPLLIDVSGRMGTCPACKYVFCPFCKMAYHGVAPCKFDPALKRQICQDYLHGDAFKKSEIENRHGKRVIKTLVEEVLSEEWLGSNSKPCPHCNASIEKTEGCNKMTCFKCGTYFCWLCGKQLSPTNPYRHYSEKGSACYDRLFPPDYMEEDFMFDIMPGEFLNI